MPPRKRITRASATSNGPPGPAEPDDSASATRSASSNTATATNIGTAVSKRAPPRKAPPAKRLRNNNIPDPSTHDQSANPLNNNLDTTANESANSNTNQNPTGTHGTQDSNMDPAANSTQGSTNQPTEPGLDKTKPTFDNYRSLMNSWPPGRIRQHLQENKPSNRNRPSHKVKERVKLIYRLFKHELLMLAMISEVSETTIKNIIPGLTATKGTAISCYTLFLEYYLDCLAEPMPLRGQDDGDFVLSERNKKNGDRWTNISPDEKAVFDPKTFFALAGVPNPLCSSDSEDDEEEEDEDARGDSFVPVPKVHKLSVEDDNYYRPIYERVVDLKKVEIQLSKPPTGPSNTQLQRKSKTAIEKIAHNLACEANRLDFAYYLVATSTLTPNNANELGWLKEFTTHPQVATWANKTTHLATVFATYSQGQSMAKAIELANLKPKKRQRRENQKQQPSDQIKVNLGRLLAALTQKTLGYLPNQSFPQTADPAAELKKRSLPMKIVLTEGSRLTDEKLAVGFKKMLSATKRDWLNDITEGKFRLVKLQVGSGETIGDPVALDSKEIEIALVTPAREMDKVVQVESNSTAGEPTVSQERPKKGKDKRTSESSDTDEDSDFEEED